MTFDRRDTRFAQLDAGEALFAVHHNAATPFELVAGAHRIRDVGTVFDVVSAPAMLRVAVAEGAVLVDPHTAAVTRWTCRTELVLDARTGQAIRVSSTPAAAVGMAYSMTGDWSHSDAPLSEIALPDLSRTLGVAVSVDAAVARASTLPV